MTRADSASAYGFLQGKRDRDAGKAHQSHVAKIIYIRPKQRLLIDRPVDQTISSVESLRPRGSLRLEEMLEGVQFADHR